MRWKEAFSRLHQANPSLADAFDHFYHQLDESDRSKAEVSLQSYPFTAKVLDTGTPYWPDGSMIEDDYVVAKGLPFGVILSRSCEIFEYTIPLMPDSPKPTVLLSKGNCIGLFELLDGNNPQAHGGRPDWSITAGSTSIRSLVNFDGAGTQSQLRKQFGVFDAERFKQRSTLSEKAMFIPGVNERLSYWTVDILFFNKFWFDCLFTSKAPLDERASAAYRLKYELQQAAWGNVSKIRAANTSFMQYFSPGLNTTADMRLVESSYALTSTVADAVYSRSPVYVLDSESEDVAPINAICEELLKPFMKRPLAIRPAYLGDDYQVGYVPLEFISPYIIRFGPANHNTRDRIIDIAQKIRTASELAIVKNGLIFNDIDKFFGSLAFKVPAVNSGRKKVERASVEFKISLDASRNIKPQGIDLQDFFCPYMNDLENQRCEFFRSCVRIEVFRPA